MLKQLVVIFRNHRRWLVVGTLFVLAIVNNLDRQTLSVLGPILERVLHFGPQEYSYAVTAFLAAYALGYVFCGSVIDRFGVKIAMAGALAFWSLAAGAHAFATGWISLAALRFLLGLGESFISPAGMKAISEWVPHRERGLSAAIFSNGNTLGAIIAPPLIAMLALRISWRAAFIIPGVIGLLLLPWWWRRYCNPAEDCRLSEVERTLLLHERDQTDNHKSRRSMWQLLAHPLFAGFFVMRFITDPITYFLSFWIPHYLTHDRGFSLAAIGFVGWLPFMAGDIGGPGGGALSDLMIRRFGMKPGRARSMMMLIAACIMPVAIAIVGVRRSAIAMLLLCIAYAAQSCWMANQLALISESVESADVGKVLALSALGGSIGGMVSTLLAGHIIGRYGYQPIFTMIGFLYLIAWTILQVARRRAAKSLLIDFV